MKQSENTPGGSERLFEAFGNLSPQTIESAKQAPQKKSSPRTRRGLTVVLAATLALVLMTFTAFAVSPELRKLLNMPFLEQNTRKETVPEGWIGVYTTDDLNDIRKDLNGSYILMNDLTFADGETFTPIGTQAAPFMGEFDGNGYVIRNLTIDAAQENPPVISGSYHNGVTYTFHDVREAEYVGLFGYCGYAEFGSQIVYNREMHDLSFPYLIDDQPYRGMICNLGVENARIVVDNASHVRVGVIVGQASYVAGCYVKDCTIEVVGYERRADSATFYLRMGGIAGNVQVMDSCYTVNCALTVTGADDLFSDGRNISGYCDNISNFDKATVFIGGLAGNVYTAVDTYSEGIEIACDYTANRQSEVTDFDSPAYIDALFGHIHLLPNILNDSLFKTIQEAFYRSAFDLPEDEPLPEDWNRINPNQNQATFDYRKFQSFFIGQSINVITDAYGLDPTHANPSLLTGDYAWESELYLFDRAAHVEEILLIEDMAVRYIGAEKLAELISAANLKVGPHYCYILSPYQESYKESDLDGFNFDTVWKIENGRPVLQIFD